MGAAGCAQQTSVRSASRAVLPCWAAIGQRRGTVGEDITPIVGAGRSDERGMRGFEVSIGARETVSRETAAAVFLPVGRRGTDWGGVLAEINTRVVGRTRQWHHVILELYIYFSDNHQIERYHV